MPSPCTCGETPSLDCPLHGPRRKLKRLMDRGGRGGGVDPAAPKRIHLRAHVRRRFDSVDNLRATLKPTVDALHADWCRLIHTDADTGGHVFEYEQVLDRAWQGVELSVRLA